MKKGLLRTVYYLEKIHDLKIHRAMGFPSISAYANAAAGLTPSQTKEFLYLARRLSRFPEIAEALNVGDLSWSRAREIIAKTDPKDQQHWLELARSLPRKELRRALAEQTAASQQESPS